MAPEEKQQDLRTRRRLRNWTIVWTILITVAVPWLFSLTCDLCTLSSGGGNSIISRVLPPICKVPIHDIVTALRAVSAIALIGFFSDFIKILSEFISGFHDDDITKLHAERLRLLVYYAILWFVLSPFVVPDCGSSLPGSNTKVLTQISKTLDKLSESFTINITDENSELQEYRFDHTLLFPIFFPFSDSLLSDEQMASLENTLIRVVGSVNNSSHTVQLSVVGFASVAPFEGLSEEESKPRNLLLANGRSRETAKGIYALLKQNDLDEKVDMINQVIWPSYSKMRESNYYQEDDSGPNRRQMFHQCSVVEVEIK